MNENKDNNIGSVMESLMKGVETVLTTKTVVGEATKIDDTIIIPLVDVSFGIGAGATCGSGRDSKKNGGGGGMSGKMSPSAVLLIKNGQTKLVNIKNQDGVTKILDMIPDIVEKFTAPKAEDMMSDEEAVENAFPDEKKEENA
ncbi:MAG: GerW family sporulation protein [Lachnospiraceae bacterium]|nr:GerW family sporulation protein [Lachnospiraceae bacterium]